MTSCSLMDELVNLKSYINLLKKETIKIDETQVEKEKKELLFTVITREIDLCKLMIQQRECKEFQTPEPSPEALISSFNTTSSWAPHIKQKNKEFFRPSFSKKADPVKEEQKKEEPVVIK